MKPKLKRPPKKQKYRNVITERDGKKFRSKKEAEYYDMLVTAQEGGYVRYFIRQPMFELPGGVRCYFDFLVFYYDRDEQVIDVKGKRTQSYIRNKKLVEAMYPVKIDER